MYCHSCGTTLSPKDSFCPKCGNQNSMQNDETEALQYASTLTPDPKPYDPYNAQPPVFYGSQTIVEEPQNPYAPQTPLPLSPPKPRRLSSGFLKGFLTGIVIVILLAGGLTALLILRQGEQSHPPVGSMSTPHPTAHSTVPATTPQPTTSIAPCTFSQDCEAENATLSGGEVVRSDHQNYTGTGFAADYGILGATVTWTLNNVPASANDALTIRYANSSAGDGKTIARTLTLYINSSKTGQVTFPITSDWDTWSTVQQTVPLHTGNTTIALACDPDDSCNVNIDSLTVAPQNS